MGRGRRSPDGLVGEKKAMSADAEVARLTELRQKGCDCNDEDACRFARERDEARAEVERLRWALLRCDVPSNLYSEMAIDVARANDRLHVDRLGRVRVRGILPDRIDAARAALEDKAHDVPIEQKPQCTADYGRHCLNCRKDFGSDQCDTCPHPRVRECTKRDCRARIALETKP